MAAFVTRVAGEMVEARLEGALPETGPASETDPSGEAETLALEPFYGSIGVSALQAPLGWPAAVTFTYTSDRLHGFL